jgi:hypothetical protein
LGGDEEEEQVDEQEDEVDEVDDDEDSSKPFPLLTFMLADLTVLCLFALLFMTGLNAEHGATTV